MNDRKLAALYETLGKWYTIEHLAHFRYKHKVINNLGGAVCGLCRMYRGILNCSLDGDPCPARKYCTTLLREFRSAKKREKAFMAGEIVAHLELLIIEEEAKRQ